MERLDFFGTRMRTMNAIGAGTPCPRCGSVGIRGQAVPAPIVFMGSLPVKLCTHWDHDPGLECRPPARPDSQGDVAGSENGPPVHGEHRCSRNTHWDHEPGRTARLACLCSWCTQMLDRRDAYPTFRFMGSPLRIKIRLSNRRARLYPSAHVHEQSAPDRGGSSFIHWGRVATEFEHGLQSSAQSFDWRSHCADADERFG